MDLDALRQKFVDAGFDSSDLRIWYQAGNSWYRDGEDYWEGIKSMIPESERDEAIHAEIVRLFNETRADM